MTQQSQKRPGNPPMMPAQLGGAGPQWQPIPPPMGPPPPPVPNGGTPCPCPHVPSGPRRGARLVALSLLLIALVIAISCIGAIVSFLRTIGDVGSNDPKAQIKGLAAFGLCAICILAALRIALSASRGKEN